MAVLLNRVPTGRLVCLHALLQHLVDKYKKNKFTLRNAQFDINSQKTIHDYCSLLIKIRVSRSPVCPFLQNPLSPAKCYLTQSLQRDTQKQKSVGDAVNGLEALGLLDRVEEGFVVNKMGFQVAGLDYCSEEYLEKMRECVASYGLFLGFLFIARNSAVRSEIKRNQIKPKLAFPETSDVLTLTTLKGAKKVRISTGCKIDTTTRTTSLLSKWSVTLGYTSSKESVDFANDPLIHVTTLDEIKNKNVAQTFTVAIPEDIFKNVKVTRPIEHSFLNPDPSARRDLPPRERRASIEMDGKIKNRRLAIINSLSSACRKKKFLNFTQLKKKLSRQSIFVINQQNFDYAMNLELVTAIISGALWELHSKKPLILRPLTTVDEAYLRRGAPRNTLRELDRVINEPSIYV